MTASTWRTIALTLGALCLLLTWRSCRLQRHAARAADCAEAATTDGEDIRRFAAATGTARTTGTATDTDTDTATDTATAADLSMYGVRVPGWVRWFAPQPGESLLDYRDRMVPIAQAAVAPHRARVARGRDRFATEARLDSGQRAELDAAVEEAASAIQDRVMQGLLGGELLPGQVKPSTGVTFARDVLDSVDRANRRFTTSLRDDQRDVLAGSSFDVADYLLFSTRWEDMLGVTQ